MNWLSLNRDSLAMSCPAWCFILDFTTVAGYIFFSGFGFRIAFIRLHSLLLSVLRHYRCHLLRVTQHDGHSYHRCHLLRVTQHDGHSYHRCHLPELRSMTATVIITVICSELRSMTATVTIAIICPSYVPRLQTSSLSSAPSYAA